MEQKYQWPSYNTDQVMFDPVHNTYHVWYREDPEELTLNPVFMLSVLETKDFPVHGYEIEEDTVERVLQAFTLVRQGQKQPWIPTIANKLLLLLMTLQSSGDTQLALLARTVVRRVGRTNYHIQPSFEWPYQFHYFFLSRQTDNSAMRSSLPLYATRAINNMESHAAECNVSYQQALTETLAEELYRFSDDAQSNTLGVRSINL